MKFKAYRNVTGQALRGFIPKRYHPLVDWADFKTDEVLLLLFHHDKADVILSSVAQRALESVAEASELHRVAVGGNFTKEADELLSAQGFRRYALGSFLWTDERYKHITKATV